MLFCINMCAKNFFEYFQNIGFIQTQFEKHEKCHKMSYNNLSLTLYGSEIFKFKNT